MATDKKISALVSQQLPDFIRDDGPLLEAFIKAYYEWMEQTGQTQSELKSLLDYQDVDNTSDTYFEFLKREVLDKIPDNILGDKRLLAKYARDLYRSKGSENSFRFLFRALFNEEIDVYYPADYILRTSDGRWVIDNTIRITNLASTDTSLFDGKIVTGQTTGAKGRVQAIVETEEFGVEITELFLSGIIGEFADGEQVVAEDNSNSGTLFNDTGVLKEVIIQRGGSGHQTGDAVNITASSGSGALGTVAATSDRSAITFTITDGGSGYTTNAVVTIEADVGDGASFEVTSISNTEIIAINSDTIDPLKNVVLSTAPTFTSLGTNTATVAANLASANINSILSAVFSFANTTVGSINSISILDNGAGYENLPSVSVIEPEISSQDISDGSGGFKGRNAVITPSYIPGAITRVNITNGGTSYSKFELVTISNTTRSGTNNAIASSIVSGQVTYPGRYIDTKGWISWDNKLQDGNFYQEFSYVIRSTKALAEYRETLNELLHPAGTKLFGEVQIVSELSVLNTVDSVITQELETEFEINVPSGIITTISPQYAPEGIGQVYEIESEIEISLASTSVESNVVVWALANGTITISAEGTIGDYANTLISVYANTQIQALGNPKFVSGTSTVFEANLANGEQMLIIDNDGVLANGVYNVNTISSNTALSLTAAYENAPLANGSYYYSV